MYQWTLSFRDMDGQYGMYCLAASAASLGKLKFAIQCQYNAQLGPISLQIFFNHFSVKLLL